MNSLVNFYPFKSQNAKECYLALNEERAKSWPTPSEDAIVDTSCGKTFVRINGPKKAPPLVLLHGFGASSLTWQPNIIELSENFRTYAVDNICDNGLSVNSKKLTCSDDFTTWLDELFDNLGLEENINLMGFSYGGWFASQYALRYQNRLDKIIMLAPAKTVLNIGSKFSIGGLLGMLGSNLNNRFWRWAFEDAFEKDDEEIRDFTEQFCDDFYEVRKFFKFRLRVLPSLLNDEELQSIQIPTLIIYGENEKLYSAQKAIERLNAVAPDIKTDIIPDAGHDLSISQAKIVNKKVIEFLK